MSTRDFRQVDDRFLWPRLLTLIDDGLVEAKHDGEDWWMQKSWVRRATR